MPLAFSVLMMLLLLLLQPHTGAAGAADSYTIHPVEAVLLTRMSRTSDAVAGLRRDATGNHGFLFSLTDRLTHIGPLQGGRFVTPSGICGPRVVGVGTTGFDANVNQAFVWAPEAGTMDVGTRGGQSSLNSAATDCNATDIVGYGTLKFGGRTVPVLWIGGRTPVVLPTLSGPGSPWGRVQAINASGQKVGQSQALNGRQHATLWAPDNTTLTDLHAFGKLGSSLATDITDAGEVVGYIGTEQGDFGFRWTAETGTVRLRPLAEDVTSMTWDINRAGDSVGQSFRSHPTLGSQFEHQAAVLWPAGQEDPIDLSTRLGAEDRTRWQLEQAVGISNTGVIAGMGTFKGARTGFLLVPVSQ